MNHQSFARLFPLGSHLCREPMPPLSELKEDMQILRRHGFNLLKLQEHWAIDEPLEGHVDFSRYEELIDHASELDMGVYLGLTGPTYETPAEVRMIRGLGADAVGMSTVMEAMAANWAGMRVCGVSLVTNPGAGLSPTPLTHTEVVAAADEAGPRLAQVIGRFAAGLG